MISVIACVAGIIIGWNLPQPQFAKDLQARLTAWVRSKV
jgi:hypothetical protein